MKERRLKVLIMGEYSGMVRNAFGRLGHKVISCDLLPGELYLFEDQYGEHYQGDVRDILFDHWDLMIAFPPCTYLSYAGTAWWNKPGRKEKRFEAMKFFKFLYNAPIKHIAIENPRGWAIKWRKADQEIHPYHFGEPHRKRTCLWLKNLKPLVPTDIVVPFNYYHPNGKKKVCTDLMGKGGNREQIRKNRAKFWNGIADAMADQWTNEILSKKYQL